MTDRTRIILASASKVRGAMFKSAGISFTVEHAQIDEEMPKEAWRARRGHAGVAELAETLARAKALDVSGRNPGAMVVGADQVLALGQDLVSKAQNRDDARAVLRAMRGRQHALHSAAAIAVDGTIGWSIVDTARLCVRNFSDVWLERYLEDAGDILTTSVGAYAFEGQGIQLFESVDGDYFTILGLPLLPVLAEMRRRGAIET